jgi:hypothetical protein
VKEGKGRRLGAAGMGGRKGGADVGANNSARGWRVRFGSTPRQMELVTRTSCAGMVMFQRRGELATRPAGQIALAVWRLVRRFDGARVLGVT